MRRPRSALLAVVVLLILGGPGCSGAGLEDRPGAGPAAPQVPAPPPAAVSGPSASAGSPELEAEVAAEGEARAEGSEAAPTRARPTEDLEITFAGDVIFGRFREAGYDPIPGPDDHPFAEIKEALQADLVLANLETPLARSLPTDSPIGATFRFGAKAEDVRHLVDAGITAVSLANNHAFDLRADGMRESPAILKEHGIVPLGASREEAPLFRVEVLEAKGWRIGVIAATTRRNAPEFAGTPRLPFAAARELPILLGPLIQGARGGDDPVDAVIVFVHWGDEYADAPASIQQTAARKLIDQGALAVIGHHPHVLQGIERRGHGIIAYSLGNFLFENTHEIPRLTGVLRLRLHAGDGCLAGARFHPAYIKRSPSPHPVPAVKGMGKTVRGRMMTLSKELGAELGVDGEDLTLGEFGCPVGGASEG
ncbi:MAG: CapA family protein [Nannocystaceae bacterium]